MKVGRAPLFFLDTDLELNHPDDRALTSKLYSGGAEMRLRQEWILGTGGVRVLRALGINPAAWHANEGHAAFMILERVRELVTEQLADRATVHSAHDLADEVAECQCVFADDLAARPVHGLGSQSTH